MRLNDLAIKNNYKNVSYFHFAKWSILYYFICKYSYLKVLIKKPMLNNILIEKINFSCSNNRFFSLMIHSIFVKNTKENHSRKTINHSISIFFAFFFQYYV